MPIVPDQTMTTPPRLSLASRSPRRRLLLDEHGFEHDVISGGVDDSELRSGRVRPREWVAALAWFKATAGARAVSDGVVLGADTLCVADGDLLGQPANAAQARATLDRLNGGTHEVLTGVALACARTGRRELFVDRSVVAWDHVRAGDLEAYVATGEWRGKAGAYNLRERLEAGWPISFEGDPTSIMGLPMRRLAPRLAAWSVVPRDGLTRRGGAAG